jgi:F-type H+-transporting ATPase subunit gamma
MSTELKDVRHRIAGTKQIGKVTSALQMIASARLQQYRRDIGRSNAYRDTLRSLMSQAVPAAGDLKHPLLTTPENGVPLLIVFGTDRGLCGGFNADLLRSIQTFGHSHPDMQMLVIGTLMSRRVRRLPYPVMQSVPRPRREETEETVDSLVEILREAFTTQTARDVHMLYHHFRSPLEQIVTTEQILPLSALPTEQADTGSTLGWAPFEPSAQAVLDWLIPEWLHRSVFNACLNSLGSEAASRKMSMARATDNAKTIIDEQSMLYRRLRQESITTEMLELSGGNLL